MLLPCASVRASSSQEKERPPSYSAAQALTASHALPHTLESLASGRGPLRQMCRTHRMYAPSCSKDIPSTSKAILSGSNFIQLGLPMKKERPRKFTFGGSEARFRCPCRAGISIRVHVAASLSVSTTGPRKCNHILIRIKQFSEQDPLRGMTACSACGLRGTHSMRRCAARPPTQSVPCVASCRARSSCFATSTVDHQ